VTPILPDVGAALLHREGAEAAQLDALAASQSAGDLVEYRRHDQFHIRHTQMRIAGSKFRDEVRSGQRRLRPAESVPVRQALPHAGRSWRSPGSGALRRRSEPVTAPRAPQLHHAGHWFPGLSVDRPSRCLGVLVPAWLRAMTDDEAYMQLVLANTQGELSAIERGMHALHSGMSARKYADSVGRPERSLREEVQAARVFEACGSANFADIPPTTLSAIGSAQPWLWHALVQKRPTRDEVRDRASCS
jgi:hypothetical protein